MDLKSINFKQPKYVFPLVFGVILVPLLYFMSNLFSSSDEIVENTDKINMNLPDAKMESEYDKLKGMERRYDTGDDNITAVDAIGQEVDSLESLDNSYTDSEIDRIIREAEAKQREQQQLEEMQRRLSESSRRTYPSDYEQDDDDIRREIQRQTRLLSGEPDTEELARAEANRLAQEEEKKKQEEAPSEVIKAANLTHSMFNTVESQSQTSDSPLIKAMIDKTTKSTDGTRLRFKLLDDVIIEDVKLLAGSYLYGTVTGFDSQRVKASITSILAGSRFLKVDLSVYDIDGMEGFYVPESSFREFMQDAAASVAGQSVTFNNNSDSGNGFNAENFALQALQNIYQAGSNALSKNAKKNKAKIKYNTIVYLINSKNV